MVKDISLIERAEVLGAKILYAWSDAMLGYTAESAEGFSSEQHKQHAVFFKMMAMCGEKPHWQATYKLSETVYSAASKWEKGLLGVEELTEQQLRSILGEFGADKQRNAIGRVIGLKLKDIYVIYVGDDKWLQEVPFGRRELWETRSQDNRTLYLREEDAQRGCDRYTVATGKVGYIVSLFDVITDPDYYSHAGMFSEEEEARTQFQHLKDEVLGSGPLLVRLAMAEMGYTENSGESSCLSEILSKFKRYYKTEEVPGFAESLQRVNKLLEASKRWLYMLTVLQDSKHTRWVLESLLGEHGIDAMLESVEELTGIELTECFVAKLGEGRWVRITNNKPTRTLVTRRVFHCWQEAFAAKTECLATLGDTSWSKKDSTVENLTAKVMKLQRVYLSDKEDIA